YYASPSVLTEIPWSALWYVSLAGFSQKTLSNVRQSPATFGMTTHPGSLMRRLISRESQAQPVPPRVAKELLAFCAWVNDQIDRVHPLASRDGERATIFVAEIIGGR